MSNALTTFSFALSITAPIFVVLLLGNLLKKYQIIDQAFVSGGSRLVYNLGLPVMLFISSAKVNFSSTAHPASLLAFCLMTLLVFGLSLLTARWFVRDKADTGVLVQGAFRGNLVILGLAFCANAYGEQGLALASLPVAITVVLYNLLSVYVLNLSLGQNQSSIKQTVKDIARNPLILAIAAGLVFNFSGLIIPQVLLSSGNYLSQMVLPLALLCIGASLDISRLFKLDTACLAALGWKLVVSPLLACALGIFWGLRGDALAILFLLAASPTATVSFVMVQALKGNATLAAEIVAQTTLWSLFTVTGGLWLLQTLGFI